MPAKRLDRSRTATIVIALFGALCLLGAELGQLVALPGGNAVAALWPPSGLLVAALILADGRHRMVLLATACGAMVLSTAVFHGRPVLPTIGLSIVFGVEGFVAAWLVRRTTGPGFALDRVPHTWALIVCATVVPIAGGAVSANMLASSDPGTFFTTWRAWWLANTLGIIVTAPPLLAAIPGRAAWPAFVRSWKGVEALVVVTGAVVVAAAIFGEAVHPLLRAPAYVLPFLLWPTFRFGPGGAAAALFAVAFIGLWNAAQGLGPFALADTPAASLVLRSQGAMGIAAASFLLLASLIAERKRVALERAALVFELQQALAEIKTLRGFIPICAWCHNVRDDAGFWQRIEKYLDGRTEATFSHSICPACADEADGEIASLHRSDAESAVVEATAPSSC